LTFDNTILGEDLFDKQTGTLKVKNSGVYIFHFSAQANKSTWIGVYMNDDRQLILFDNDDNASRKILSFTWTLDMAEGDTVQLKLENYGKLYVDADQSSQRVYFSGFLMKSSA